MTYPPSRVTCSKQKWPKSLAHRVPRVAERPLFQFRYGVDSSSPDDFCLVFGEHPAGVP